MNSTSLELERFFSREDLHFEEAGARIADRSDRRLAFFSEPYLQALSLVAEQGGDSRLFFQRWGSLSASLVVERMEEEMQEWAGLSAVDMPVREFLQLLGRHVAFHGLGELSFDLRQLEARGFLVVEARESLFDEVLEPGRTEWFVGSFLGEIFSIVSSRRLRAFMIPGQRRFLIGAPERVRRTEQSHKNGVANASLEQNF